MCTNDPASYVILGPILTPQNNNINNNDKFNIKWEEAIAIRDSDIIYIGSENELYNKLNNIIGESTKVIRLTGDQMVMPGFQDGHVHPLAAGIRESRCSLEQAQSWRESLGIIERYMESNPDIEWITGSGWHWTWFAEELDGKPIATMLDIITKDKPAIFRSYDGHNSWCNTMALKRAGLFENIETEYHCNNHIERHHETRFPTGLLHDEAMPLIYGLLPPLTAAQKLKGLEFAFKKLYKNGITSFQDAMVRKSNLGIWLASYGVLPNKDIEVQVEKMGMFPRTSLCLLWEPQTGFTNEMAKNQIDHFVKTRELVENSGKTDRIRAGTVKVMLDGTIESQTAYLHTPYLDSAGSVGSPLYTKEELCFMFTELDKLNFQIHVHAIGDATVSLALDAFEWCRKANPEGRGNRHHIAHLQLMQPTDIPRFGELNVVANFQPYWFLVDYDKHKVRKYIGPLRYNYQYPIKSVIEAGGTVAFGSDYPFGSLDPIAGIHTAVNHFHPAASLACPLSPPSLSSLSLSSPSPSSSSLSVPALETVLPSSPISLPSIFSPGLKSVHVDHNFDVRTHKNDKNHKNNNNNEGEDEKERESCRGYLVFRPEEKIALPDAVYYYTQGAAFVNYSETVSGTLEVGKKADLIILSNNIYTMDKEYICDTVVQLTMANGSVVYNNL